MPKKSKSWLPFQALPTYAGSKRKLMTNLFSLLRGHVPESSWKHLRFADAFSGGGSVSLWAKAQGFCSVSANDWSQRSQIVLQGLLANDHICLDDHDLEQLLCPPAESGYLAQIFTHDVFTERHAKLLDTLNQNLGCFQCPIKQALGRLLMWHLAECFVGFSSTLGKSNRPLATAADGITPWWELNPKRLKDRSLAKLLAPVGPLIEHRVSRINRGVFGGNGPVHIYQQDAFDFVRSLQSDILYLDSPYPQTLGYERHYQTLDHILFGTPPKEGKSTSPFTQSVDALEALLKEATHVPVWLISYGNKCIDASGLKQLVQGVVPSWQVTALGLDYTHMSHSSKNDANQELLVLAFNPTCSFVQ